MFEHMKVGHFTLRIRAQDDLSLPAYKGSTFRGAFGQALKQVVCALRRQECPTCLLRDRCVYVYLFETPPPKDSQMMRLYPSAPHPFIIEPPNTEKQHIPRGEAVDFGLVLVGRALEYLPYFIYGFIRLGENGLGRGRGKVVLEEVSASGSSGPESVYHLESQVLRQASPFPNWEAVTHRAETMSRDDSITLEFLTPTRIKFGGHLVEQPEFHHLIRPLLRRLSSLSYFHCGHKLELDFRGLTERAQCIERATSDLRWHDWERYSSRQQQHMSLGGFVGRAAYHGDLREFLPLLAWGEVLHVGKAASFGLGKYSIRHGLE